MVIFLQDWYVFGEDRRLHQYHHWMGSSQRLWRMSDQWWFGEAGHQSVGGQFEPEAFDTASTTFTEQSQ